MSPYDGPAVCQRCGAPLPYDAATCHPVCGGVSQYNQRSCEPAEDTPERRPLTWEDAMAELWRRYVAP
jgi:hypothetical protein